LTPKAAEPSQRLFFALWPSAAERRALAHAVVAACAESGGRAVAAENLHLTLAFLGSVPQRRLGELAQIGRHCAAGFRGSGPIAVTLTRLEHWSRPQIIAATAAIEPDAACSLAEALKNATAAAGFAPDLKPFRAHVTVARKVTRPPPALASLRPIEWRCNGFALVDSRTESDGPVYSVVEFQTLVKEREIT
jgi:2'-5' RNA ligase